MFRLFNSDVSRTIASLVGALLLSTTFVGAAIAPAHIPAPAQAAITA